MLQCPRPATGHTPWDSEQQALIGQHPLQQQGQCGHWHFSCKTTFKNILHVKKIHSNNVFIYLHAHVYITLDTPRCLLGAPEDLVPLAGVPRDAPVPVPVPGRLPRRAVVPLVAAAAAGAALHAAREAVLRPAGPVVRGRHQGAARVTLAAAEALFVEL